MQVLNIFKQNRFFGTVSIAGTAVIIAFVMVIWMAWEAKTRNIVPEDKRSETVLLQLYSYRTEDKKQDYYGLCDQVQEQLFSDLCHARMVVAVEGDRGVVTYLDAQETRYKLYHKLADTNIFKLFRYEFVAGRPFTSQEMESGANVLVLNQASANKIFGSAQEAVGKTLQPAMGEPCLIVGVMKDVSSFFDMAFSQVWRPARFERNLWDTERDFTKEGPSGNRHTFYLLIADGGYSLLRQELAQRVAQYNQSHPDYTLVVSAFYRTGASQKSLYILIICVLLMLVPAINSLGLNTSLMAQRRDEIGLRKAYGATRLDIVKQLFLENMFYTFTGGIFGLGLSWVFIFSSGPWFFISSLDSMLESEAFFLPITPFFNWRIFAGTLFFCLCFNLMSTLVPAMKVSGTRIIHAIKKED